MMVRRFIRYAFPLAALAVGALALSGCNRHCGWNASPEKKADHIAKKIASELDLSAEQKLKLDKIKLDLLGRKGEFQAVHAGMKDMLMGQLRGASVDTAVINKGLDEREGKMKEMRGFLVSEFAEFHAMLTPAQREKLAVRLEKMGRHCR
jgi:Spy/CpxP family protein refolding chaperone